jgi:hypothetical protein
MIASSVAAGALAVVTGRLAAATGQHVMHDLRVVVFRHLQDLSLGYLTRTRSRTGELIARVIDIGGVASVLSTTVTAAVQNVTSAVAITQDAAERGLRQDAAERVLAGRRAPRGLARRSHGGRAGPCRTALAADRRPGCSIASPTPETRATFGRNGGTEMAATFTQWKQEFDGCYLVVTRRRPW